MKKLGFGLMRLPQLDAADPKSIDIEQVKKMVDIFLEKGFTYFDTAWMYHGFASEKAVKEVLVDRYPRESYTLATKLHAMFLKTPEDMDEIFNAQLENTGVEYFDYYLLHGLIKGSYGKMEKYDAFSWVMDKKEKGLVKSVGISFHDNAALLDEILTKHPEIEFVQIQLNYLDWESEWIQSRQCYEVCVKHGKPVVVMEPVKGGTLASVPEEAEKLLKAAEPDMSIPSWAVRFAASLDNVMMVLSGMSSLEQMQDNVSYMEEFQPLTDEENELCFKVAEIINSQIAVPCTACSYCTDGCPKQIPIPQYFSLYNELMREDLEQKGWTASFNSYNYLAKKSAKASECIGCGQCESMCPQHLQIAELLKDVAERFENIG